MKEIFEKTLFLFGAGSTFEAECMVSTHMLEALKRDIDSIEPADGINYAYRDLFKEIYVFMRACLSFQVSKRNHELKENNKYSENIEDFILILRQIINKDYILPQPIVGSWSEEILLFRVKRSNIFELFLDFILARLINWIKPNAKKARALVKPFKSLFEETIDQDYVVDIFTLNYDLVFEQFLNSESEKIVNNGFLKHLWKQKFATGADNSRINLFKIHGSIDWYFDETDQLIKYKTDHQPAFNPKNPSEIKPHIILGYQHKLFSVEPFFSIVQEFINKLRGANLIVIVGYSFNDSYINNLIIQEVNKDKNKRLLIVDPKWSQGSEEEFVEYIKLVQSDKSSMNLRNTSLLIQERVKLYSTGKKKGAKSFFKDYLANKAKLLSNELIELTKDEKPF
jgi:hypothetical protein